MTSQTTAALDALGIVDLSEPGPSDSGPSTPGPSRPSHSSNSNSKSNPNSHSTPHSQPDFTPSKPQHQHQHQHPPHDLSADALGLPSDAQIIRVPEGERYRVRAVYDFEATDESALSFRAGHVIEVLTMLPSGWWDGMLGTSRGWFPSNYVEDVDDELYDGEYVEMGPDGRVVDSNGGEVADWGWQDSATSLDELALELLAEERGRGGDGGREGDREGDAPGENDAWVPSLTGDGRVYYHNTQTGQDAWDIPEGSGELSRAESRGSQRVDEDLSHRRLSAYERARESTQRRLTQRDVPPRGSSSRPTSILRDDPFRVPPNRSGSVPYPWVARLSDDGRGYIYINQLTGESRADLPSESAARRSSIATSPVKARHPRPVSTMRNPTTTEWERRVNVAVEGMYHASVPLNRTISSLIDNANFSVRDVYEAAASGAAAEEELTNGADEGLTSASEAEEMAIASMVRAYDSVLAAVRDLFVAMGYVGPTIPTVFGIDSSIPEEKRPQWANDISLIGALGALWMAANAAATGLRVADAESPWHRVMRAATKLRGLLDAFPTLALPELSPSDRETATGKQLLAWFGADSAGEFLSGKFGFGATTEILRPLDQAAVVEIQKLKAEVEAALRAASQPDGSIVEILRTTTNLKDAVAHIDIAVMVDLDGEQGSLESEDAKIYAELVSRARLHIKELEESLTALDDAAVDAFLRPEAMVHMREAFSHTVGNVFRALSNIFVVSQEQAATVEQGVVRGAVGLRSPDRHSMSHKRRNTQSVGSLESLGAHARRSTDLGRVQALHTRDASIASSGSHRATGSEQEFVIDSDEQGRLNNDKRSSRRLSRASQSGSTSQTSLVKPGASSSSTSLVQETSEGGSLRGNRSSILKAVPSFLRNRSGSEADRRKSKPAKRKPPPPIAPVLTPAPLSHRTSAPPAPPPAAAHGQQPEWYTEPDYDPNEIVLDDKGAVKAGTIRALIARLTPHTSADTGFFQAFLLTYRSFVDTTELVTLLFERYAIQPPEDLEDEALAEWKLRKQRPIQLRVANVLKAWLEHHFMEDKDQEALDMVDEFASSLPTDGSGGTNLMAKQLMALVERRRRGENTQKNRVITGGLPPPSPIPTRSINAGGKPLSLLEINPLELARQLTIIESANFQAIKPVECLNKSFQNDPSVNAPHIFATITMMNALAGMIQTQVMSHSDPKYRAAVIKQLIKTATECHALNNFSSMAALVAGLKMSTLARLKKTWAEVSDKQKQQLDHLEAIMDRTKNFAKYHELLKTINPPCVPFIGFYLSALVFIEDGNRNMVPNPSERRQSMASMPGTLTSSVSSTSTVVSAASSSSNITANGNGTSPPTLINFFKRALTADIIRDIGQYQSAPYNLQVYKPVHDWVKRAIEIPYPPEDDLWALSLALEPKEISDDRNARSRMVVVAGLGALI